MAQRPDGKAARTERVVFTLSAAERISKAVRIVEAGDRDSGALSFGRPGNSSAGKVLYLGTVIGQWATASTAVVTFYNVTSTPNTVSATNLYLPIHVAAGKTAECVIAKGGTQWYLTSVNFTKLKDFSAGQVQLFGHNTSGYAQWYSISTCSTSTSA